MSEADFGMPDESLLQSTEPKSPATAQQADGSKQPGLPPNLQSTPVNIEIDSMSSTPNTPANPIQDDGPERIPYWLQQAERFLRVIVRLYLGVLVCCAPWYPAAWDNNPLFQSSPSLSSFVTHGAVRGIVSGLGVLNLWIAIRDAIRGYGSPGSR